MEGFCDDQAACCQFEQHPAHVSDSAEDSISDEDVLAQTGFSLACAASNIENDDKVKNHGEAAIWNGVLEEADELAYMHKELPSVSLLSGGSSRRSKSGNKLRFSIHGSWSGVLNAKTENSCIGEQELFPGKLVPPTRTSQTMMSELLENLKEETEGLPLDFTRPNKKAMVSVAELLEDLHDRSGSFVTPILLDQHTKDKERRLKVHTSKKKTLTLLGQRILDNEDPLEYVAGETSSEEEDASQNHSRLANKNVKEHTMVDLFQEAFSATNMEGAALPTKLNGTGFYGRIQQIVQIEKDRHAEFLRQSNGGQGDSKGIIVQILSRSLEGKVAVCICFFNEESNFPITRKASTGCDMDDSSTRRTVIFRSKICDNVDLVAGNVIRIYPPWKEVLFKDERVILCTYFSHELS